MQTIFSFAKREIVLLLSLLAAALSMLIVPPDITYAEYIDTSVLILLFCLMAVVAGFRHTGVFDLLSQQVLSRVHSVRALSLALAGLCFFTSMLITNDVALLTFVPLTLSLMQECREDAVIFVVVLETVAANMGSLMTPVGNPQNLFLFTYYDMSLGAFLKLTLPLGLISLLLLLVLIRSQRNAPLPVLEGKERPPLKKRLALEYGLLFLVCILAVLKIIPHWLCLVVLVLCLALTDRKVFREIDYSLLLTFVCFFIFVGNLGHLPGLQEQLHQWLSQRALLAGALMSQVISNVPAAIMLAPFTENAPALLLGVDIGGLGTLVASLASLISFKAYCQSAHGKKGRYLLVFSGVNLLLLALLLPVGKLILLEMV